VSLAVRCVSYRQKIIRSGSLIQLDNLCLLIGELSPLTFRIMIERYLLIPVFLLLFSQVESHVDYSLLLALFIFRFCWFAELIMFATFLALMSSSTE
jgi:hypothetical protein